jgi:hypothetical protein
MLKKVAISTGADIMVFMSEAWALSATKQQLNKRVSEHDEKYDALIMVVQVKGGDTFSLMAKVKTESGIRSVSKPDWTHSAVTTLIFDWAESVVSH